MLFRSRLEAQLEELKQRKDSMSADEYQAQLEAILVQLAKLAQQIRGRS